MNPLDTYLSGDEDELQGDVYTSGTEILGATRGPRRPAQAQGRRSVASEGGSLQRVAAGIPRQTIAAAASADLQITVSEPFRPDRIVLSTAAQALDVSNIKIGTKSLNVTSNPISGNCFSEQAINTYLQGYTAQPGVGFVLSVTNNTGASITSGGGVFGPAVN
jgi:hypothetical protein